MPCPCRISTDAGGTVRPGSFSGASQVWPGSSPKAIPRAGLSVDPAETAQSSFGSSTGAETDELSGGERGIRTLDTGLSPYNALAGRPLRPLGHLSEVRGILHALGDE